MSDLMPTELCAMPNTGVGTAVELISRWDLTRALVLASKEKLKANGYSMTYAVRDATILQISS